MHQRRFEAVGAVGLEQVIERVHFKRAERVLVVRGDEDDRRHRAAERARQRQAVDLRHLNIEKHQIGRRALDRRHRLRTVAAFADQLDVRLVPQQRQHPRPGDRLIVGHEGPDSSVHAAPITPSAGA